MGVHCFKRYKHKYLKPGCSVFVLPDCFAVMAASRTGFVYAATMQQFHGRTIEQQRSQILRLFWEWPVKRKDKSKMAAAKTHASEKELRKFYPQLADFMTAAVFEGSDEVRESPTVTLWCGGGLWKASVKDRSERLVMWLSAETPHDLLTLLEGMVNSADAPWRHDDFEHERNGKRKRKDA